MLVLLDTGILLRLLERSDPHHGAVRGSVRALRARGDTPVISAQNMAEFWNVCTRPASARGGLGLSVVSTHHRLQLIERGVLVIPDQEEIYVRWKELVLEHRVMGVQVHDARIVAAMMVHGIRELVTLNASDFF